MNINSAQHLLFAAALIVCGTWPTCAATIAKQDGPGICSIKLSGSIENGDAARLRSATESIAKDKQINLCLQSDGGSFSEGLKIVEDINKSGRGVRTIVEKGSECLSACALVFMAGRTAGDEPLPDRLLHIRGSLGFHAPFIKPGAADYDASVVERAHRESLRAISRFLRFYNEDFFPDALIGASLRKKPNEFLFVDTVNQAARWDIRLLGVKLPPTLRRGHLQRACQNYESWFIWNRDVTEDDPTPGGQLFNPVQFNRGQYRDAFHEMGDESVFTCAIELYQDTKAGLLMDLKFDDTDNYKATQRSLPYTLEAAAKRANDPLARIGRSFWYIFDARTKLKDLPEQ